jgi:hypothetical protein
LQQLLRSETQQEYRMTCVRLVQLFRENQKFLPQSVEVAPIYGSIKDGEFHR